MSPRYEYRALKDEAATQISGDRRSKKRYALDLALTYRVLRKYRVMATGSGRTSNMSSSGLAFVTNDTFHVATYVELSISWPVLLNDNCLLKLIVEGTVVRSGGTSTAIRIKRHEFRTRRRLHGLSFDSANNNTMF
jgi:hypothetical protein